MLLWTLGSLYLSEFVFSFSLIIYLGVELLDHMVVPRLVVWESPILFFTVAAPVYILRVCFSLVLLMASSIDIVECPGTYFCSISF